MKRTAVLGTTLVALVVAGGATAATHYLMTASTRSSRASALSFVGTGPRGFSGSQGPQGVQGIQGPQGARGPAGLASVTTVNGPSASMCTSGGGSCDVGASLASCPAGTVVVAGGWDGESNPPTVATVGFDEPLAGDSWEEIMANNDSTFTASFHAVATCTAVGGGAARDVGGRGATSAQFAQDVAAVRARGDDRPNRRVGTLDLIVLRLAQCEARSVCLSVCVNDDNRLPKLSERKRNIKLDFRDLMRR